MADSTTWHALTWPVLTLCSSARQPNRSWELHMNWGRGGEGQLGDQANSHGAVGPVHSPPWVQPDPDPGQEEPGRG